MNSSTILIVVSAILFASCAQGINQDTAGSSSACPDNSIEPVQISAIYTYGDLESAGEMYSAFMASVHSKAISVAGDQEFTQGELIRLGVWEDRGLEHGGNIEHSLRTLSHRIGKFYTIAGRLPVDAMDVVAVLGNTEAVRGDLYNPVTGDWYQSFTADEWDINAVNIEIHDDPAEARRILLNMYPSLENDGVSDTKPARALRMVVYGEKPGSVIFDDWFF